MGLFGNLVGFVAILTAVTLFLKIKPILTPPAKPQIDDIWWGPGDPSNMDTSIKPFMINISGDVSTH